MTEYVVELNDSPKITIDGWNVRCDDWLIQHEQIVRCRDCEHFATNIHGSYCKKSITWLSEPDGFCAWGERGEP